MADDNQRPESNQGVYLPPANEQSQESQDSEAKKKILRKGQSYDEYQVFGEPPKDPTKSKKKVEIKHPEKYDVETLELLNKQVQEVVETARAYQNEGLLTESAEEFIKSCEEIKSKINAFEEDRLKLDRFKNKIDELEKMTLAVNKDINSPSMSAFLDNCNKFKAKLEGVKRAGKIVEKPSVKSLDKTRCSSTSCHGRVAIKEDILRKAAIVPKDMEDFIAICERVAKKLIEYDRHKRCSGQELTPNFDDILVLVGSPYVPSDICYCLNDIIAYLSNYYQSAKISSSLLNFLKKCETVKSQIDQFTQCPVGSNAHYIAEALCSGICSCKKKESVLSVRSENLFPCESCRPIGLTNSISCGQATPVPSLPSCSTGSKITQPCQRTMSSLNSVGSASSLQYSMESSIYPQPEKVLGYTKRSEKRIIKINRYRDKDGKIKEEKTMISVLSQKYDPTISGMSRDISTNEFGTEMVGPDENSNDQVMVSCCQPKKGDIQIMRYVQSDEKLPIPRPQVPRNKSLKDFFLKGDESELYYDYDLTDI